MHTLIKQWLDNREKRMYLFEKVSNDEVKGYAKALKDLTADLPSLLEKIKEGLLKEVGEDEKFTYPDPKHLFLAGNAKGDNKEIKWAKHCVDKNADRNIERAIRNEERSRTRQIITKFLSIKE